MAYPGRPPMVPGIPLPPNIGIPPYMPPMIPPVMTMPPIMPVQPYRQAGATKYLNSQPKKAPPESGPAITVFIGNIVEHAPDLMIRHILASCGQVLNWKRIQGFGFCEFGSPESALRAVRLLHDMSIGPKKLVVKVDANTTVILDEYKKAQRRKQGKPEVSRRPNEEELEDYVDDQMRMVDRQTRDKIYQIIDEFEEEMKNALIEKEEENKLKKEIIQNLPDKNRAQKSQEILTKLSREAENSNIQEEFEEGKRDIITREIGKFREIMKKQEAEREEERLRREEMGKMRQDKNERVRSPSRSRSISIVRSPRSPEPHSKASTPEPRHKSKNRRGRSHSRSRDRDRERDREREPRERQSKKEVDRAVAREREEEEEAKERKKLEKKTREKEVAYQERVRAWETRERRKRKDYEKEKERKRLKEDDIEREAKKLKEFLEDYDDERDDIKFYKGRELQRRIMEREREREADDKDRAREKEEIEELRIKVLEGEHNDPTAVYEQLLQEHEELYKPKIIIDVNAEQIIRQREREREERERLRVREKEKEEMRVLEEERRQKEEELARMRAQEQHPADVSDNDNDSDRGADLGPASNHNSPSDNEEERRSTSPVATVGKKKKLDVKDVFNADEDEDNGPGTKRRKLVPLDYGEEKSSHKDKDREHRKKDHHKKDEDSKSTEEKRKHIKSLIDKIPTDKSALFEFTIDWSAVDNQLMERRIRPWINKKIIEYIGEPEPTLVDFICSKVLAGSQPQGILDDVQMVLDEEAEVFVVKMWRLLIYEIEAKKLGLVK